MDGHSSHYCPATVRLAAKEQVILFVLPPNTTHLLQPLDKAAFAPMKVYWREECHNYMSKNPGQYVNRYCFSQLFSHVWMRCITMGNVRAGFKVTGIFPFNRDAVAVPKQKMESLPEESGLSFIPLYSPAPSRKKAVVKKPRFTEEEEQLFERRYKEGYDITDDPRYNMWLECYYPDSITLCTSPLAEPDEDLSSLDTMSGSERCHQSRFTEALASRGISSAAAHRRRRHSSLPCHLLQATSQIQKFLRTPSPPTTSHLKTNKSCGRVLTSYENIQIMEAKQREKEDKARMKLEQKKQREEKRQATQMHHNQQKKGQAR